MPEIKALLFDVFGTVVDWRTSVREFLIAHVPASHATTTAAGVDWDKFADEWRNGYYEFTFAGSTLAQGEEAQFVTVDQQYRMSLGGLATKYGLNDMWSQADLDKIADAWHYLKGKRWKRVRMIQSSWDDTVEGLSLLKSKYIICTLSNGNVKLLVDMAKYANLPWDMIFGGDVFKVYKPSPLTYLGAAEFLKLKPENICMVAAHIYDLQAAKALGFNTAYVNRQGEDIGKVVTPSDVDYYADSFIELFSKMGN
ncbi:HAD-like domain-containing protein [Limtongia smithiae]|uniref:HAD-like domain-containing protein n=1 Tax=Limtongia smithiae TaxID=1125753 RepID=UPI0034CF7075